MLETKRAKFGWKPPLAVQITETALHRTGVVVTRYWVDICPRGDGNLKLTHRDLQLVSRNGVDGFDPSLAKEARDLAASADIVPTIVVRRNGTFSHVEGAERTWAAIERVVGDEGTRKPKITVAAKGAVKMVELHAAALWARWVGTWLEPDLQQLAAQASKGSPRVLACAPGPSDGRIIVTLNVPLTGVEVVKPLESVLKEMSPELAAQDMQSLRVGTTLSVDMDWPNVKPWRVRKKVEGSVNEKGKKENVTQDNIYEFDWYAGANEKPHCGSAKSPR